MSELKLNKITKKDLKQIFIQKRVGSAIGMELRKNARSWLCLLCHASFETVV